MERASSRPADVRLCKKLELKAPVGQPAGNRYTCSRVVLTLEKMELGNIDPGENGTKVPVPLLPTHLG